MYNVYYTALATAFVVITFFTVLIVTEKYRKQKSSN